MANIAFRNYGSKKAKDFSRIAVYRGANISLPASCVSNMVSDCITLIPKRILALRSGK